MSRSAQAPARRVHGDAVYSGLKTATADILDANGKLERAADRTRGSAEQLRRCARHEWPDQFIAVDQLVDLEGRAPFPWVTAQLAEVAGYLLVPSPDRMKADGLEQRSIKQAAEAIAQIAEASADGRIDRSEVPPVRKEILEAILTLYALDQELARRFPDQKPLRLDAIADLQGFAGFGVEGEGA